MDKHIPQNIAFELSNRCNYSHIHPECPTEAKANPVFLKTEIILDVIDYMSSIDWTGNYFLNIYNEPLIDPRVYFLCDYIKKNTKAKIEIFTNGWNLNEYLFNDMVERFDIKFTVSVYNDNEDNRLRSIKNLRVQRIVLNPIVKQIYQQGFDVGVGPCLFPSIYPSINSRSELVLCCRDYEYRHIFADLKSIPFRDAINSEYRMKICDELQEGIRSLDACKQCPHQGWGITNEMLSEWRRRK